MLNPAPAPLFRDPIYDGAADPTLIWNRQEEAWWIIYTQRRANLELPGVAYCHGSDLGIASSTDGGQSWLYRGILRGLEFEPGHNTFWAPEVIWHDGLYHLYVSYIQGVPSDWRGSRRIVHMTSENLWDWHFVAVLPLSSQQVIDACVYRLPSGIWRLWYKDELHGSYTYAADSKNLFDWTVVGPVISDVAHEGPNVFYWHDVYWMLTDEWRGLGVYRSPDAQMWTRQPGHFLATPGVRRDDGAYGRHPDVLVQGEQAYIFYFTHPEEHQSRDRHAQEDSPTELPYRARRTSLQVAQLTLDNELLACSRDTVAFQLTHQ
nr:glycosyl hydrolase [Dictyobacter kobayashii]